MAGDHEFIEALADAVAPRVAKLLQANRDDGFFNAESAADYLDISLDALYGRVKRRSLPFCRSGGRLLFDRRELRAAVERGD
jgi:excisionase family DNA binding protein